MRFLFILFLSLSLLHAIVDIAPIDFGQNEEGFSGSVFGYLEKKRGNTQKDEVELGGRIQYDSPTSITWLQGAYEQDKVRGALTDENSFLHLRHVRQLYSPEWALEFFVQNRHDYNKNLDSGLLIGSGVRYRAYSSQDYGKIFLGTSLMFENINYIDELTDPNEQNGRLNSYLSYDVELSDVLDFSTMTYYQPKFNHGTDYYFSTFGEITAHLTKVFDLSYIIEYEYDSNPAIGLVGTDVRRRLSLVYRFGADDPFSSYAHSYLASTKELEDANTSEVVAVAVETDVDEIKDETDTLAGEWVFEEERFTILLDGIGEYHYGKGLYDEKVEWTVVSTQTQEGVQGAKDQSTKLVIIKYVDEEGRQTRVENFLWSENSMVGLTGSRVRHFHR